MHHSDFLIFRPSPIAAYTQKMAEYQKNTVSEPLHIVFLRRFAFVMTKKGHEDAAGRMLGPAVLKARILRKLGYEVIWLPFNEVQKKAWKGSHEKDGLFLSNADRREGADYLRDKILEHWESDSGSYLE